MLKDVSRRDAVKRLAAAGAGAALAPELLRTQTSAIVDGRLEVTVYPGADGSFTLYDDDGKTFTHRSGE